MTSRLYVHHPQGLVGLLERGAEGGMRFAYHAAWLHDRHAFALSTAMPLRPEAFHAEAHAFFSNLLPEAELRRAVCRRLGLSVDNDFELLAAIGGECAGALTLSTEETVSWNDGEYRELAAGELEELSRDRVLPAIDARKGVRLSLAGAQDKVPVRLDGRKILIPLGTAPSTHILKFANPSFRHLPANEVLTTLIARHAGLEVVDAELWPLRREGMCVVARYDRVAGEDGRWVRLHQEDLCQALGLPASQKYEKEGGPAFVQILDRVRASSVRPLEDSGRLLRWLVFNVLVWNADAHAKNVSLLSEPGGWELAPAYDLVCTRAYDRLDRDLAQRVGGATDPSVIERAHWEALAREATLGAGFVVGLVRSLGERLLEVLPAAQAEFKERFGTSPALERVLPQVRRNTRRVLSRLQR